MADNQRLGQLVIDTEPHLPDNEATRAMDLPARLKAEVERLKGKAYLARRSI